MILVCPECSTNYDLPNGLPEGGGKVRCTGCAHIWHATEADLMDAKTSDSAQEGEIPAVSPHEADPLEELDFNEIEDEIAAQAEEEQGQDDIDALFDEIEEPAVDETQDQSGIDDLFDAPLEEDEGGEDNSQDDIDGLFDAPDDGGEDNSQDDIDGLFDEPDDAGEDNSQDDIDGLFDEEESSDAAPEVVEDDLDEPFPELSAEEEPAKQEVSPPPPTPKKGPFWKQMDQKTIVGWSCYGVVLFLVCLFVISARVPVVRAVPAMAGFYQMLGMGVNVRGVMFTNVQQRWETGNKVLELQFEGEVINLTNKYKKLAPLVFVALSKNRREVFRWVVDVRKKPLLPGEKAPFQARVPAPPGTAQYVLIRFE